jgi:hypothetical protein
MKGTFFSPLSKSLNEESSISVLTVAENRRHLGFNNFLFTAEIFGFTKIYRLRSESYKFHSESAYWLNRLRTLAKFLNGRSTGHNINEVFLIIDSYDSLFFHDANKLLNIYNDYYDGKVVFAAEELCDTAACRFDLGQKAKYYHLAPLDSPYKFPNAGVLIGKRQNLLDLINCAITHYHRLISGSIVGDDQSALGFCYTSFPQNFTLDYHRKLFAVISSVQCEDCRELFNSFFNSPPHILHFAGVRYEDNQYQKFNPCQKALANCYNFMGHYISENVTRLAPTLRIVVVIPSVPSKLINLRPMMHAVLSQSLKPSKIYIILESNVDGTEEYMTYVEPLLIPDIIDVRFYNPAVGQTCKLIPVLEVEKALDTLIVTIDDDMIYKPNMLSDLVRRHMNFPHAALGYAGQVIDADLVVRSADTWRDRAEGVDILEAFLGAIYRRDFFDDSFLTQPIPEVCKSTDDIWISAHLAKKKISRIQLPPLDSLDHLTYPTNERITLRTSHLPKDSPQQNLCAFYLLNHFQKTWYKNPHACPVRFEPLKTASLHYMGVDASWDRNFHISKCSSTYMKLMSPNVTEVVVGTIFDTKNTLWSQNHEYSMRLVSYKICIRQHLSQTKQNFRTLDLPYSNEICYFPPTNHPFHERGDYNIVFQYDLNFCMYPVYGGGGALMCAMFPRQGLQTHHVSVVLTDTGDLSFYEYDSQKLVPLKLVPVLSRKVTGVKR